MSRNVSAPGRSAPAMRKQIGREPVANTSLANGNALPSDSVTVRAAISAAVTADAVAQGDAPIAPPGRRLQ